MFLPALGMALLPAGCRSRFVEATISNHTDRAISVVQVDYPSASFGTQGLAPGADFHYRFKLLGDGPVKITWTDKAGHEHTKTGPSLSEGAEGALHINFESGDSAEFQTDLHAR